MGKMASLKFRWRPPVGTRACSLNVQPNSKVGDAWGNSHAEDWSGWRLKNEASLHAYSTPFSGGSV